LTINSIGTIQHGKSDSVLFLKT